jgi:hypothetical protein
VRFSIAFSARGSGKAPPVANLTSDRIERNNNIFRDANESIREAARRYDHSLEKIPFLCECPVEDCLEIVLLTEEEYAAIRADPHHYMTAVGHEEAEKPVGRVIARRDRYIVIDKS